MSYQLVAAKNVRDAAREGNLAHVQELMALYGPDIAMIPDSNGRTALQWAQQVGQTHIIDYLLSSRCRSTTGNESIETETAPSTLSVVSSWQPTTSPPPEKAAPEQEQQQQQLDCTIQCCATDITAQTSQPSPDSSDTDSAAEATNENDAMDASSSSSLCPLRHESAGTTTAPLPELSISIQGAGSPTVNGMYSPEGQFQNATRYTMNSVWNNVPCTVSIFVCEVSNTSKHWYISIVPHNRLPGTQSDVDFYTVPCGEPSVTVPPRTGWVKTGEGLDPPPVLVFRVRSSARDSPGRKAIPTVDIPTEYVGGAFACARGDSWPVVASGSEPWPISDSRRLLDASKQGDLYRVQQLFQRHGKPLVEAKDEWEYTALHWACRNGRLNVAKYLVERFGANVMAVGRNGWTPLHWASLQGRSDIMRYLVQYCGVNLEAVGKDGRTALHWASELGHLKAVQYLVTNCARTDRRCKDGHTPLDLAQRSGKSKVATFLTSEIESMDDDDTAAAVAPSKIDPKSATSQQLIPLLPDDADFEPAANGKCGWRHDQVYSIGDKVSHRIATGLQTTRFSPSQTLWNAAVGRGI
jgi:ankyrin repeat protein